MISCSSTGDALAFIERCDNTGNLDTSIQCSHAVTVGTLYTSSSTVSMGVSTEVSQTIQVDIENPT